MAGSSNIEGSKPTRQPVSSDGQRRRYGEPQRTSRIDSTPTPAVSKDVDPAHPPHILLAEDNDEMRTLLSWRLRKDGYEVTECKHGLDLIDRIAPSHASVEPGEFHLIISDIRMPGVTGLEVLEGVRNGGIECPPVILITAFGDRATHEQAYRLGVEAILDKPFNFEDLLAKVHELAPPKPLPSEEVPS